MQYSSDQSLTSSSQARHYNISITDVQHRPAWHRRLSLPYHVLQSLDTGRSCQRYGERDWLCQIGHVFELVRYRVHQVNSDDVTQPVDRFKCEEVVYYHKY